MWNALESLDPSVLSGSHTCAGLSSRGGIDNAEFVMRIINDAKEDYWAEVQEFSKKQKQNGCVVVFTAFVQLLVHTSYN